MTEFVPTTAQVRDYYALTAASPTKAYGEGLRDFDRWLAQHDAEVRAKALREFRAGLGRRFWFQDPYGHADPGTVTMFHRQLEGWLDDCADRIEREVDRG